LERIAFIDVTAPLAWAVAMDMAGGGKIGTISISMNYVGLTKVNLSTVFFAYLAIFYGYYLPVLAIGIIVLWGSFVWLKIDSTQKIEFKVITK